MNSRQPLRLSGQLVSDGAVLGYGKLYLTAPPNMWQIVVELYALEDCRNVLLN
jgi:hypothetical protein